ncbi:MAG: hypothetical protein ACLTMR_06610 [Faecalibacillus sp.]
MHITTIKKITIFVFGYPIPSGLKYFARIGITNIKAYAEPLFASRINPENPYISISIN